MRALVATGLGLALSCSASLAHADDVNRVRYALDAEDATLRISADTDLRAPRMRIERGTVRLWFAGLDQKHFLDEAGDGEAVRHASVRPGEADTALVVLRLGDRRRLTESDVRVAVEGHTATVRIARSALPQTAEAAAAAEAARAPAITPSAPGAAVAPASAAPASAAPATGALAPATAAPAMPTQGATPTSDADTATAAGAIAPAAAPAASAPATGAGEVAATAPVTGAAAVSTPGASAAESPARLTTSQPATAPLPPGAGAFAGSIPDAKGAGLRTIGLIIALLGGLALFGRWLKQRRASQPEPAIRVLASHRLGPKHQLLVVRAFDQEILLSVNGNETRRIASRRAGEPVDLAPLGAEPEPRGEHRPAAVGRLLALVPPAAPALDRMADATPTRGAGGLQFDDELARMVRSMAPGASTSRPSVSDSVSGLVRLREAKGAR
jgi:hypothetical protein